MISTDISVPESPTFDKNAENSPESTASSPLITTPPDTAKLSPSKGPIHDPPTPPMSDASTSLPKPKTTLKTPVPQRKCRIPSADSSITPKPRTNTFTTKRPAVRGASAATSAAKTPANRLTAPRSASHRLPATNSLSHIRSLTAQVQRLEARVHTARSRLPAPRVNTPPRVSPAGSVNGLGGIPSTVTIRSRKRGPGSTTSASVASDDMTPTHAAQGRRSTQSGSKHIPRLSTSGVSRLSFGPLPNRGPGESDASASRPSSRASVSSGIARPSSRTEMQPPPRPLSRTSLSGTRTPLSRPRSSLSGSVHGHSQSVSRFDPDETDESDIRTPSRRGSTLSKYDGDAPASRIPAPSGRQSTGRRASSGIGFREPTPLEDLDETY